MFSPALVVLAAAGLASAHFELEYPSWRADSLTNDSYSQYDYPCANVPSSASGDNRTDWPLAGGSLKLDMHHKWSYVFVNIGLGASASNFNYSLTPSFWNETGSGTLCVSHLDLPADLTPADGQLATLQVVTVGESGAALYNCADITFRAGVADFGGDNCTTDVGVAYSVVTEEVNGTTATSSSSSSSSSSSAATGTAATGTAATGSAAGPVLGLGLTVLAVVFACGLNL